MNPAASPSSKPPRWACQAIFVTMSIGKMMRREKKIKIATQSDIGTGMGNIMTGTLGTITASAPPSAKTPPEAPIPTENG